MSILSIADHAGVVVFALSGGVIAVRHRLDLFGVVVLALVSSLAGGVLRDVALGDTPPVALRQLSYPLCAVAAGLVAFMGHRILLQLTRPVAWLDALGLGVFTVAGCEKAMLQEANAVTTILIATLTAVGGGVVRDLLVAEVPLVLREEIYAVAAMAGAAAMLLATAVGAPPNAVASAGLIAAVGLRLAGMRWGWRAPRATCVESSAVPSRHSTR